MHQTLHRFFKRSRTNWRLMYALFTDVLQFSPFNLILTLLLMLFRSISAGASLLLIIPLLQVIGISTEHNKPFGIAKIITNLFQHLHVPLNLLSILVSYIIVVSVIASAAYAEQIISSRLQQHYIQHLRSKLYHQLLHTKWLFFLKQKMPTLLHTLTAQIQTISGSNVQLLTLINNALLMCAYLTIAFFLSWQMTLVAMACALLLLSMMLPLHRLTSQSGRDHLLQNQTIFQSIAEQLGALKMIKSAGFETKFSDETQRVGYALETKNQHLTYVTAITKLLYSTGSVLIFSVLLYTSIRVFLLPLESLLLLLVVFSRLLPMVSSIQQSYQRILHQLPAYCDVRQLLQASLANQENLASSIVSASVVRDFERHSHERTTEAENINNIQPSSPLFNTCITLNNVSFSYKQTLTEPIFSQVSLQIKKNTTTAITGPSGAGKSTLADLIVGLIDPSTGTICIDQHRLDNTNKLAWRQSVAYVTQDVFLFNASIRDNLQLFCPGLDDDALWTALKSAAAADFVAHCDDGLDTIIGDRGVRFSGGECQRLALARALLSKPQLLILDESTRSLDNQNIIKIQQALTQLRGKITILIISHQTEMSHFADQHISLNKGTVHGSNHKPQRNQPAHRSTQQESLDFI